MARANQRQIKLLRPYLIGERPRENGEWDMYCPLHDDATRSASLNIDTGLWYCQACETGGRITELIRQKTDWRAPGSAGNNGGSHKPSGEAPTIVLNEGMISGWHSALMSNHSAFDWLNEHRGLSTDTIQKYEIGWHMDKKVYCIPIRNDIGEIWNVRFYNPNPPPGRRKVWGVKGYNSPPRLYPIRMLNTDPGEVVILGGEWDALIALQYGYPAITRTGAEDVWDGEWSELFQGRIVYLCHDMDHKGQKANRKIGRILHRVADVRLVELPFEITPKHGKDVTDFFLDNDPNDFRTLLDEAKPFIKPKDTGDIETVTVLDSFSADQVGQPKRLLVTIKGRKEPGYTIPRKARLACTRDAGNKCTICPLNSAGGEAEVEIAPDDPLVLALMESTNLQMHKEIAGAYGVPGGSCVKLQMEMDEHQAVEVLFARPSLDHADGTQAGEYKNIRITSVGRHDTLSNNTVAAVGALQPNPRSQSNEFLSWDIEQLETSVDRFEITDINRKLMERFRPRGAQRPLAKLGIIAKALSEHVTFIHGRPEMHALMDLTFHSVLAFKFGGQLVHRGWLESLIVGDTRTGKSEAAQQLVRHYGAGEIVGGEAASLAGLVGGLQQLGGRDWAVTWGVIPINDRRLVVIDELSGLLPEDISKMSDVRASGLARLTKIQQDVTFARTRLLWMGNPRNADMANYTYGVDALKPLIGNSEDIARFDLAMAVRLDDVPADKINVPYKAKGYQFTSEACHQLLMWAWTRQPEQVVWVKGAEDEVFKAANDMGARYVESPPLVQAANIRIKIARTAVALAARLFSTDASAETILVRQEHVQDAVAFIDRLYGMTAFGYRERSREAIADRAEAESKRDEITDYLRGRPTLSKYLRSTGKFRRQDLEEVLNITREEANAIINTMWEARMVRKDLGDIRVEPTLHALLRETKW